MDLILFNLIHDLAFKSEILDFVLIFFAKYSGYFLIVFSFLFLFKNFRKYKFLPFLAFFSGILARYGTVDLVRFFYHKERPFVAENVSALIEHAPTSSFPSGHTAFFFAFSTIVFLYNKKLGYFFYAFSFLIGFSRIASGVHWPLDILAGIVAGIATGYLAWIIFRKVLE